MNRLDSTKSHGPRILIPISVQFSVRYLLRTGLLERIADYARPVAALAWSDSELEDELRAVGCDVTMIPVARWGERYSRARARMNRIYAERLASPSEDVVRAIEELSRGWSAQARFTLRDNLYKLWNRIPGAAVRLEEDLQSLWKDDTNANAFSEWLDDVRPDAYFCLTPYLRSEELAGLICKERGIPTCTSILSFDNITSKGWCAVLFERYMVWNEYNRGELVRANPEISTDQIELVGAPQFDFYQDPTYIWDEEKWRAVLGIPAQRPVILYGGGFYGAVGPNEPYYIRDLDEAIEAGELPHHPVILFRRHPLEPRGRWADVLDSAQNVVTDEPWETGADRGRTNIRRRDIERLATTLHHSAVHINVASTMTVDGAFFDRPLVAPAYDGSQSGECARIARDLYTKEHYLPISTSGGLDIAYSRQELIDAVRDGLMYPEKRAAGRRRLLKEICTFVDGRATERVDRELQRFLQQHLLKQAA